MNNKDLIIKSLIAHRNYMYNRMSSKNKMFEFLNKTAQILDALESDKQPLLYRIPKKDCGQNIAIDIYNEICYNVNNKFVTGREVRRAIERI